MSIKIVGAGDVSMQEAPVYDTPPTPEEIKAYEMKMARPERQEEPEIDDEVESQEETQDEEDTYHATSQEEQLEEVLEEPKTPQQKRFATLRKENERLEREREEARKEAAANLQLVQQYQQYHLQQSQQEVQPVQPAAPQFNFKDDDLVEWGNVKKYTDAKLEAVRQQTIALQKQIQAQSVEQKILTQYPDFYKVASTENCAKLRKLDPALADTLYYTQDPYLQAQSTYNMIKRFGILEEEPRGARENAAKFEANKKRPRSTGATGSSSPLSQATKFNEGLSEAAADALWKETLAYAKQR